MEHLRKLFCYYLVWLVTCIFLKAVKEVIPDFSFSMYFYIKILYEQIIIWTNWKCFIYFFQFYDLTTKLKRFYDSNTKTNSYRNCFKPFKLTMNPGLRLFAFLSYKRCSGQLITDDVAFIAINDPVKRNKM